MSVPSARSRSVEHFLVMEILERAQLAEARGEDIVHLEVGEPDFPSPTPAVRAAIDAISSERTHYTHSLGVAQLRAAIAARFEEDYGIAIDPERVIVTLGSSAALVLAMAATTDPGDEVVTTDPGYACYPNIARSLGATATQVRVSPETGFAYDPQELRDHIGPRTSAVVVNSPSNPTGTLTPPEVLEELAALEVPVISDEIYHGLTYEGQVHSMLSFDEDAFVVSGFSKRYAMTGWRLGYMICPRSHLRAVQALQQNMFVSASDFGQWAALAALDAHDEVAAMRKRFDERRRYLLDALPDIGLEVPVRPQGAFYVFADARSFTGDSMAFALELLEGARVAVAPGIDFGPSGEGFLRFSYATSLSRIEEGVGRLGTYLASRQLR